MGQRIGIMQGRLTPPAGRGIQFFPFENWEQEFHAARRLGLYEIEFIFDYENYTDNPLWTEEGIQKIRHLQEETGIQIRAVCFDYFMRRAFYKKEREQRQKLREENTCIIRRVIRSMEQIGIGLLEIPLVDDSSLKQEEEREAFREWLLQTAEETKGAVRFALETDLAPADFYQYLQTFCRTDIGANYDSGNSSGIGYDPYEEVTTLKEFIFNIHIKDRKYHGPSVTLGSGSADFERLFRGLSEIGYCQSFILQAARGSEGDEEDMVASQTDFVRNYMEKYGIKTEV